MINFDLSSDEDDDDCDPFAVSLRFKIPKQAKAGELLQTHESGTSDFKQITRHVDSSLKIATKPYFRYDLVQSVNNERLESEYSRRKADLKKTLAPEPVQEVFSFLYFDSLDRATAVCRNGPAIGNFSSSPLANPQLGVSLCRHADIVREKPLDLGATGFVVAFKTCLGKCRAVAPCSAGSSIDPDPNFDCYSSAEFNQTTKWTNQVPFKQVFNNSQLYIFEYDMETYEAVQRPRHVLPYAVFKFKVVQQVMPTLEAVSTDVATKAKKRPAAPAKDVQPEVSLAKNNKSSLPKVEQQPPPSGRSLPAQMLIPLGKLNRNSVHLKKKTNTNVS